MVYSLKKIKVPRTKRTKLEVKDLEIIYGINMPSRRREFMVLEMDFENINLISKKFAHIYASKKAFKLYNKLLLILTELLVTDDESGDTYMEALNQIERFRRQIKNKYRAFLTRKELEKMSKQLKLLQMEAKNRMLEINMNYEIMNTTGKSR
ncbi:MAG: hypothetical protein IKG58_00090 [Bacilli bacterium]|nr:hypothetical protein [Bacilli bacterium]